MKKKLIIDAADMGADDYVAIQYAILCNKFDIKGISLVHGNTNMVHVRKNIFKTLDMINKNGKIKIYEGESNPIKDFGVNTKDNAHGNNGFSDVKYKEIPGIIEKTPAIDWLVRTINRNPKKISIVSIGPLTNIAKAIQKNNSFAKNIKELIIMGGAKNFGNITPNAEFNFYNDPEAAKIVFESGIKNIVMVGFDITKYVTINSKLEEKLLNSDNKNAEFIYKITRDLADLDRKETKVDGAIMNDAIPVCYLVNKRVLKLKKAHIRIENNNNEFLGKSVVSYTGKPNCRIATSINSKKCINMIFGTILPDLKKEIKKII